jgi:hypothetical protein
VLLDEAVAKADPASDPAKDLSLNSPFQKVIWAWGKVSSPSEVAVSGFLQQYKPPTIDQPKEQPKG